MLSNLPWYNSMAHSSSDSCNSAPEVLEPFSPDNDRLDELLPVCPSCHNKGTIFHCEKCIKNGLFSHSQDKRLERFSEKKLKLFKLKEKKEKLIKKCQDAISSRAKVENLKVGIMLCKQSNVHLKGCIQHAQEKTKLIQTRIQSLERRNDNWCRNKFKLFDKIPTMQKKAEYLRTKLTEDYLELDRVKKSMKDIRKENILDLVNVIFPISKGPITKTLFKEYMDPDEHMESVYVTGQWELAGDSDCDFEYKIINSCLPANGNYTAYSDWMIRSSQDIDLTNLNDKDAALQEAAHNIITALSLTAHLVTVLCFYLDAHVPKRIIHGEFNSCDLDVNQFQHKVAKLNSNIIHLCLLQNVDPSHLRPHHTIDNLLLLLDPTVSDLGRSGPMGLKQRLSSERERYLASELILNADDDLPLDIEVISEIDEIEDIVVEHFGTLTDQPQRSTPRPSLTSDFMSSISSIWKAATWQK